MKAVLRFSYLTFLAFLILLGFSLLNDSLQYKPFGITCLIITFVLIEKLIYTRVTRQQKKNKKQGVVL